MTNNSLFYLISFFPHSLNALYKDESVAMKNFTSDLIFLYTYCMTSAANRSFCKDIAFCQNCEMCFH